MSSKRHRPSTLSLGEGWFTRGPRPQKPASNLTGNMSGQKRTVLVAGGAGFIGSHLCEALIARGDRVVALDNLMTGRLSNLDGLRGETDFDFIEHDVTAPLTTNARFDRVYNLACPASPPHYQADPVATMMICVAGTKNLLDVAEASGARFLMASTSEVYGDPTVHPQTEAYAGTVNTTGPRACYDEGKRAAEALTYDYHRKRSLSVRAARIFNTYGPRMRPDDGRVVSNFIVQVLCGEKLTLYGDGSQTRSFCHVSDMVDGLLRLMEAEGEVIHPVNLGNPDEFTILELARKISELTGREVEFEFHPLPEDDPKRRQPDIARARGLLGWTPQTPLDEGLPPTVRYFEAECGVKSAAAAAE